MRPSGYLKSYRCDDSSYRRLLFSLKKASIIRLKDVHYQSLQNCTLPPKETAVLAKLGFAVEDPAAEKQAMLGFFDRLNTASKMLSLTVVLNLDCNFACLYCYEGERKGKLYMTPETGEQLIDFIQAHFTDDKTELNIDFYGGEPLLSLDLIRQIAKAAREFTSARGAAFRFSLVTNGSLLTRRVAVELADLGLDRVRITLDGPAETHNISRPFKSGAGSFNTVIQNIQETWDLVRIGIGGNYEQHNWRRFIGLLDYLVETGLTPDKIAAVKFDPVMKPPKGDFSLPEYHGGCASINEPWILEAGAALREEILKRGYLTQKVQPVTCMVDLKDSHVVHFDGALYKCPAFIGKEEFAIGDLETGIQEYSAVYKTDYWKNDQCADCEYLPLCFGGCRYMSYIRDGRIGALDCRKDYLDAALETLVKQDARYGRSGKRAHSPPQK